MNKKHIISLFAVLGIIPAFASSRPKPVLLFNQKDIETQTVLTSVQGAAIFGDCLFSMRDKGYCVVIDLKNKSLVSEFTLGSAGANNHANDAFFTEQYYDKDDVFPLLYVSQCKSGPVPEIGNSVTDSNTRMLFVERIRCNENGTPIGSDLVQVITYRPGHGHSRLWVNDHSNPRKCYCYGNTVGNAEPDNRIVVDSFILPEFDKDKFHVIIDPSDRLDRFYVDEALPENARGPQNNVLQGAFVNKGRLYLPIGVGSEKKPSELFIIDMNRRDANGKPYRYFHADYTDLIPCEMEDMDLWQNKWLVCTTNSHGKIRPVYAFPINKFKLKKAR